MPAENPFEIGELILEAVEEAFAAASVTLPDRRYVHSGAIAHDCEQVVVSCQGLEREAAIGPRASIFDIEIVRCVPAVSEIGLPTAAALQESAQELLTDARLLFSIVGAESLRECRTPTVRDFVPIGPEGGFGGWRMRLVVGW